MAETLTVNDTSVTKFERNKLLNKVFGNSIKNTFKTFDINYQEDENKISSTASHNGYEKNYGCIFKRNISIIKSNNNVLGSDEILVQEDKGSLNYSIRFHLYPGLSATKTMSGNSALIQISKNKSLILTVLNENIILEKSIFLGRNKILENTCVTVSGNLVNNKKKIIRWEIKKNIW